MKRRDFFKRAGWILATLGISEAEWISLGDRTINAIASPLNRKLALLVGINQYPGNSPLSGCLTDVELQKELLIHRFGFVESDILILTNKQATRTGIESAFLNHLTAQAQSGDTVVFHFSGYGRRLQWSNETNINSLVTSDDGIDNDLTEEAIALLLQSLSTAYITTIFDTGFLFPNVAPSYLKVRSLPALAQWQLTKAELAFQQELKDKQKLVRKQPTIISAVDNGALAVEGQWTGFSAGLFTYALTQYLWAATPTNIVQVSFSKVAAISKTQVESADGVITAVEANSKTAQLWLGGLPPTVLEYYKENSQLQVLGKDLTVMVRSRNGLMAKAQVIGNTSLQIGQLVREAIRVLPRNISLNVALDPNLERIEKVDATSAFAAIPRVSLVATTGLPVDYLFGRVPESPASRYGLFSPKQELIPNSVGEAGEAAKLAVNRLLAKLKTLLAVKLWRLTSNAGSSLLEVEAILEVINPEKKVLMQINSGRSPLAKNKLKDLPLNASILLPTIAIGSQIQYRVSNKSDRPVYLLLMGLDSNKSAIALYPILPTSEPHSLEKPLLQNIVINPGDTITVPSNSIDFQWLTHTPAAVTETYLIFSKASFTSTLAALQNGIQAPTAAKEYIGALSNPVEVANAVLQDLHNAGGNKPDIDTYNLDVNNWASLNFIYQVV
ncbi:caspase family protein [Synechocystis sp. PCC 7509]|uniref:caspase family protein n=1 Tax=Synechocystis sp. PCC 7509 TaxID=927677 RepID=UPI0002AC13FE|nr:caspase family protein [Synechocystis sp. PCC 7509]